MKKRILTTWTTERDAMLIARYPNTSKQKIAEELGTTVDAIYARAIVLQIAAPKKPWEEDEEEFLIANAETMTASEIGRVLDRPRQSVNSKAVSLGVECKKPVCTNKSLPIQIEKRAMSPIEKTATGYIYRGLDHDRPQPAQRPDNRTGRFTSLAY